MKRLEFTLTEALLDRLDEARGFESRASFVRRAVESALGYEDKPSTGAAPAVSSSPAQSRPSENPTYTDPPNATLPPVVERQQIPEAKVVNSPAFDRQMRLNRMREKP